VFPHLETSSLTIKGKIANLTGRPGTDKLELSVSATPGDGKTLAAKTVIVTWSTNGGAFEVTLETGTAVQPWDEFQPHLYTLNFHLKKQDGEMRSQPASRSLIFGLRDFHAQGNEFILNGHPVYLRGTHFGGDFPLTGYPPTDVESWRKIMLTCMNYGLNHLRFHSWCPPEAAFAAADELGFYLQVECGMWNDFTPGGEMEKMLYTETDRILRAYGNHPSFLLLSASNEAHGRWQQVLPQWVEYYRAADPRHLYTPDTGWVAIDTPGPVTGADYLVAGRIGTSRIRGESGWFGGGYEDSLRGINVPVVAHELGQWCAYPDYGVITKFTGFMRPGNFEIFRDSAAAHGLFASGEAGAPAHPVNTDFALASGRFQLECYKEEIEANLRTPGLAGFQLLDLHDYTGQGTALVGLLDPFWESKGYAGPDEFKEFCNSTVPLARLTQRTFTTADAFSVPVEAAHYGKAPLEVATAGWQIISPANEVMAHGEFAATNIPIGKNFPLGTITADLSRLPAPACYGLRVIIGQASHFPGGRLGVLPPFINTWNFWLYPAIQPTAPAGANVLETSSFPAAQAALAQGKNVLFQPRNSELDWNSPPLARVPIFWNALMGPTWSRMLGLWCDTNSPALAEFPTAANCDWQWTGLLRNTRAINLNRLPPGLTPIVSAIDDWNRNDKLGLIFEAKTGPGKLLVCAADLSAKAGPVAQQLRHSLLDYLAGGQCQPRTEISPAELASLRFDTRIMRKLHAAAIADGSPAWELVDGDPNTFWSSADARGKGPQPPHVIQISFPDPVAMNGLVLMPRQNQREHQGDVREYQIELSNDGTDWREIAAGQLPSTFAEQKILFSQTVSARYIKFTARSGFGNDASAALAELAVIYAGPELPEDAAGNIEYQNIRTASPDIDAGNAPGKPRKR
jgi:hypothetical protein